MGVLKSTVWVSLRVTSMGHLHKSSELETHKGTITQGSVIQLTASDAQFEGVRKIIICRIFILSSDPIFGLL